MKIGIYGGSFDPIHTGHAMLANYIGQSGIVDEVWLMVSRLNPLKAGRKPAEDAQRLRMAEIAAEECSNVRVSDFEMGLPVPSFSYTTLCALREKYPEHEFRLIIGSDNWHEMGRWRDPEKIMKEFGFIVYPRPGYEIKEKLPPEVTMLEECPKVEISSTFIRKEIQLGHNINYYVPIGVGEYIREHRLYE